MFDRDIKGYYSVNYLMMSKSNMSLTEIENMIPFEREIYISLLLKDLKDQQENIKNGKR